jgi:O-antigen/teichoic acid export membrane protein
MSGRLLRLARDTVFYSTGLVLRRGLAFVTLPVFTRFLTVSDLGMIAVLGTVRELLNVLFELGIPNSSARLYYDCRTDEDRRRLFGTLFLFIMGTSLAGTLLLVLVGPAAWAQVAPEIPFHPYVSLTVATVFLSGMGILPRTLFRVTNRVPLYTSLGFAQGSLTAGVSIALVVVFDLGVLGTVVANLVVSLLFFSSFSAI